MFENFNHQYLVERAFEEMGKNNGMNDYVATFYGVSPSSIDIDNFAKVQEFAQGQDDNHYAQAYNRGYLLGAQFGQIRTERKY